MPCGTCNLSMLLAAIIPKVTAPFYSVDCIVGVFIKILALTSDSEFSTLIRLIFLSVFCLMLSTWFLKFSL